MKSPITGKDMILIREYRSYEFRKETFTTLFHAYRCVDSGEQFTTNELDTVNTQQIYNQYRAKFNIPFAGEITRIREQYGVSASKMSDILGMGANQYRNYENDEMPSITNAKLIHLADKPENFIAMVEEAGSLSPKEKEKFIRKAHEVMQERARKAEEQSIRDFLLGHHQPDIYSGYRTPDLEKFAEMVVFFAEKTSPYKTKLNKQLFYADFFQFKQSCFSISGARYVALPMGPVPNNFNSVFEYLANMGVIDIQYIPFDENVGEKFVSRPDRPFNATLFSAQEIAVLEHIAEKFKKVSASKIIEISHEEEAWKQNEKTRQEISYQYAFDLKQV